MKFFLSRIFCSKLINAIKAAHHRNWKKIVEPVATIIEAGERRQATLISSMLFVITLALTSGIIYMGFFSPNPLVGIGLAGVQISMGLAYALSRTRYYQSSAFLALIILSVLPILEVVLAADHSSESLLVLLIWNTGTILISSALTSTRNTVMFTFVNLLTLLLLPVFISSISFEKMALPIIFNTVISTIILVFTQQRNLLEKDRQEELLWTNQQLEIELKERKRVEEQLAYSALHDPLTDLPNRALFMDRLQHVMERAKRNGNYSYAVFFMDLDQFKVVNDSQGHKIGDLLLVESAKRLASCVRAVDTVARLGGDEFVILLEDIQEPSDYLLVADRIKHDLSLPAALDGQKVFVSISIGIVQGDARYKQPEEILRDADIAMYRAKALGRGHYKIFDPAMLDSVMSRRELETDLWKAIEKHEFFLHYQPILEMQTRTIVDFEALVRWMHPTKGLIMPADFIPTAEEIGLIVPMGYWVLEEACRQIRDWQIQYPSDPPLTINVNLSTRQCTQSDLVQMISEILERNKLHPSSLKLELTESLVVEESGITTAMLTQLREIGIQVQIDDFGTGYSSLSYLHNLPIDTLKIDRTFINQLGKNGSGSEIVRTILSLAHSLGMKVIAEGVETDDQLSFLQAMDCEYAQGFLFAKPVDDQEAGAMLSKSFNKDKD